MNENETTETENLNEPSFQPSLEIMAPLLAAALQKAENLLAETQHILQTIKPYLEK